MTKFALNLSYDRTYLLSAKDAVTIMDILASATLVRPVWSMPEGDNRSHRLDPNDRMRLELTHVVGEPITVEEWAEIEAARKAAEAAKENAE